MILRIQTSSQAVGMLCQSKLIFFLLVCSPTAGDALPWLGSMLFALLGSLSPTGLAAGLDRGASATHAVGHLQSPMAQTRAQAWAGGRQPQEVADGRAPVAGLALCRGSTGDWHGGVKALRLTLLKTGVAWFARAGCSSSPGVYHTFSSGLQNAVITNCKNQTRPHLIRAKPARLCASPARPVC